MNFSLRQLEIFLLAAKLLKFSSVAAVLKMTPPAITKQISAFEKECKLKLFEQVGKKMFLTEAGQKIYEKAETFNIECERFKKFISGMNSKEETIDISLGHTYQNLLFPLIHQYQVEHPDINFNIYIESREKQIQLIYDNTRDLGFISSRAVPTDLKRIKLGTIAYKLFGSSKIPFLKKGQSTVANLKEQTLLVINSEAFYFDEQNYGANLLLEHGLTNNKQIVFDSFMAIKGAIVAGLGVGFLPISMVSKEDKVEEINLKKLSYTLPLEIIHHRYKKLSNAQKEFIEFLKNNLKQYA